MSADPRAALATFVSALERHLEACSSRHGDNDPAVVAAYQDLADAFDAYDDALMDAFDEITPLTLYTGDDDDADEEDFDDDGTYMGLDDDDFDDDSDDDDSDDDSDDSDDSDDDDSDDDSDDDEPTTTGRPLA